MTFPRKPPGLDSRFQLAENHTHYIFIDSVDNSKDISLCRAQFEAYVGHQSDLTGEVEYHCFLYDQTICSGWREGRGDAQISTSSTI